MHSTTLPTHPATGLHALGWTKRGPIWPVMGGSGEGNPGGTGQGGDPGDPNGDTGDGGTGDGGQGGKPAEGNPQDVASLPDWAQKLITDARAEAGKSRTNAKQQAADEARQSLAQEIGKALGLIKGDEKPDPAKLAEQVTAKDTEARQARVQLAVVRAAGTHNADADLLLDSNAFQSKVTGLDPAAADFGTKVGEAIAAFVKDNPRFSAGQAPPARSGAPITPGGSAPAEPDSLEAAFAARIAGTG